MRTKALYSLARAKARRSLKTGGAPQLPPTPPIGRVRARRATGLPVGIYVLAVCIICVMVGELVSWMYVQATDMPADLPTYRWEQVRERFWTELNPHFGVWHPEQSTFVHKRTCFEATYRSNAHGMRDHTQAIQSQAARTVVLGDSFAEGWGVSAAERVTGILEQHQAREYLNFGTAGNFGTYQAALLYQHLAKRFDHDAVMVMLFPHNDFDDDDYEFWKATGRWKGYYKPFLVGEYPNYETIYTAEQPKGSNPPIKRWVGKFLREYSYIYAVAAYFTRTMRLDVGRNDFAGYYDYDASAFDRMRYALEHVAQHAQGKRVTVVMIPDMTDIERFAEAGPAPLSLALRSWGELASVTVIDLLPHFAHHANDWHAFYLLPCDGHLSPHGNRVVAEYIHRSFPSL